MAFDLKAQEKAIPVFDLKFETNYRESFYREASHIFDRAYLTNDEYVSRFEKRFAKELAPGVHATAVMNGTAALEIACRALGIEGQAVLLPTNTFIASAVAVRNAGGLPVPVDIDSSKGLELQSLEGSLQQTGTKPAALMLVHLGGRIQPDITEILEWCAKKKIAVIEDCAHAHGSSLDGVPAGCFGVLSAFSFHLTKSMTTGEGGLVVTKDPEKFAARMQSLRRFGESSQNSLLFDSWGNNFKMTELQALMGLLEMDRSELRLRRRNEIHDLYRSRLAEFDETLTILSQNTGSCGYYKTILRSRLGRAIFEDALNKQGIPLTGGVYYYPLHRQPVMQTLVKNRLFPKADAFAAEHFCPPCFPELTDAQIHRVCDVIEKVARD